MEKLFYTIKDIQELTGYKYNKSYKIIKDLQEQMKKEYPNCLIIGTTIPIEYFKKKTITNVKE